MLPKRMLSEEEVNKMTAQQRVEMIMEINDVMADSIEKAIPKLQNLKMYFFTQRDVDGERYVDEIIAYFAFMGE